MQQFTNYKLFFVVSTSRHVTSDHINIPDQSENFAAMAAFLHIMGRFPAWRSITISRATKEKGNDHLIEATRFL